MVQVSLFSQYRESDFLLRSPSNYDYHCSLLSGALFEADSVTYSINYESALNKIEDFHVCNGQLPQDIMHVLLEGAIPYTMKATLQSFITVKRYITLYDVNQRIQHFKYSKAEARSKLSQIACSSIRDEGRPGMSCCYKFICL